MVYCVFGMVLVGVVVILIATIYQDSDHSKDD